MVMAAHLVRPRRGVKLAERLAQEIVEEITADGLKPGDRLPSEVQMAHDRGVSRTSLREALRLLEVHGIITVRTGPNGGPELTKLTSSDFARMATLHFHMAGVTFRQLLEARLVLEPPLAELAAANRSQDQVDALRRNLAEHSKADDVKSMIFYAHEFHSLISDCAGETHQALSLMTSSVQGIFDVYASQNRTVKAMRGTVGVHAEIADAIEDSDRQRARDLMEKHMRQSAETFGREHPTLIDSAVPWLSE